MGRKAASNTASAAAGPVNDTAAFTTSARTRADSSVAALASSGCQPAIAGPQWPSVRMAAARTRGSAALNTFTSNPSSGVLCSSITHRHSRNAWAWSGLAGSSDVVHDRTAATTSAVFRPESSSRPRYRVAFSWAKNAC